MTDDAAYYRADVQGLNPGDATTRTLDPLDDKEYTYATPGSTLRVVSPLGTPISLCTASHSMSLLKRTPTLRRTTLVDCSSGLRGARSCMSWMRMKHNNSQNALDTVRLRMDRNRSRRPPPRGRLRL
jgi:hypothetical protein